MGEGNARPAARVGIVIPTFNRAELLPRAIESVLGQDFESWELIVVDDNSSDETPELLEGYSRQDPRIRWLRNDRYPRSCSGARKRGVEELSHEFGAFLDSDDQWREYHLSELVSLLDANPDLDWVFGDLTRVDEAGRVIVASKLREEWEGRLRFPHEQRGELFVLRPERLLDNALRYNLGASFQISLIRARVFESAEVRVVPRADDRLFTYEAAAAGARFGYVLRPHLTYLVHGGNMSAANRSASFDHREKVQRDMVEFWRTLVPRHVAMDRQCRKTLRRRLADHLVWLLGNSLYRSAGRRRQALAAIWKGILLRPLDWRYWKSFVGTLLGA